MADYVSLDSSILISRKIWLTEKNMHFPDCVGIVKNCIFWQFHSFWISICVNLCNFSTLKLTIAHFLKCLYAEILITKVTFVRLDIFVILIEFCKLTILFSCDVQFDEIFQNTFLFLGSSSYSLYVFECRKAFLKKSQLIVILFSCNNSTCTLKWNDLVKLASHS